MPGRASRGRISRAKYVAVGDRPGEPQRRGRPARAASIARCGALLRHDPAEPHGGSAARARAASARRRPRCGSPRASGTRCDHAAAVCALTAAKVTRQSSSTWIADSSHGVGGVCSVLTIGTGSVLAIAIGRWCRLWLWMTSNVVGGGRARAGPSAAGRRDARRPTRARSCSRPRAPPRSAAGAADRAPRRRGAGPSPGPANSVTSCPLPAQPVGEAPDVRLQPARERLGDREARRGDDPRSSPQHPRVDRPVRGGQRPPLLAPLSRRPARYAGRRS